MFSANKTVSFYTLGCRLNQSETAVLRRSFEIYGFRLVDFGMPADIVVINTCTVTEQADTDTRKLVNKINRINPNAKIALVGCQAQTQKEKLSRFPNVHYVVGNARKMDLVRVLEEVDVGSYPQIIAPSIPRGNFKIPVAGVDRQHTRANLKIQDGCDFFCSYCEIPYARGQARSRVFEDILSEAHALVEAGHKEIVITGINVGMYAYKGKNLVHVVDALEGFKGLERIRISSIELRTVESELLAKIKRETKVCRHLHIPLQSGSDKILKLMNRRYTRKQFSDFISLVKSQIPDICLGTDIIVGFPGETQEDFSATMELVRDCPIDYFHVFSYSRRLLAKSRNLPNPVDHKTIQKRSQLLRSLGERKRKKFLDNLMGTYQSILFEQKKDGYWTGLTDHYVRVKTKSDDILHNQILPVRICRADGKSTIGEIA